jgi:hypothetical protein
MSFPRRASYAELQRAGARLVARLTLRVCALPVLCAHAAREAGDALLRMWWRTAPFRRQFAARLLATLCGVLLALTAAEAILRIRSLPLPPRAGMALWDCYRPNDSYGSIFYAEPHLDVALLRPDYEAACYHWGHAWQHAGDHWGFRNPETWSTVDVALIGDSFTYGHGVEEHQTMAHFLRAELGVRVANLGITGASPVDYVALLRNFALPLAPKLIFVLPFANDIDDVAVARSRPEINAYLERGKATELGIYDRELLRAAAPKQGGWSLERLQSSLLTYRAIEYAYRRASERAHQHRSVRPPTVTPSKAAEANAQASQPREKPLISEYVRKVFGVMAESARQRGATLVIAAIPAMYDAGHPRYARVPDFMREVALEHDIPFLDLRPVLATPDGFPVAGTRLLRDGHLTESGHRLVAHAMASFVRERQLLP